MSTAPDRRHSLSVTVPLSPEELWPLLAEGDGLTRWFAPAAEIRPTADGGREVWLSWGPGMEGAAPIVAWEPGTRMAWKEGDKVVEFLLEPAAGGGTTLRLVHAGFSPDAKFDDEYDATSGGWRSFFAVLAEDCARYHGVPARHMATMRMIPDAPSDFTPRLLAALEFTPGYTARLGSFVLSGRELLRRDPGYLVLTLDSLAGGGMLGLFVEACGPAGTAFTASWYLRGETLAQAEELKAAWESKLAELFPEPAS